MKSFKHRFLAQLNEADELPPIEADPSVEQASPDMERNAMESELDKGTQPAQFDVKALDAQDTLIKQTKIHQIQELEKWIEKIDHFIEYINGTATDSIQNKLHDAKPDSIFDKIAKSETKKIARASVELSGLTERLKSYLIASKSE